MEKSNKINASQLAKASDLTQLGLNDVRPWYKKRNLRRLYLTLVPAALGVEMTSGYDGSVLNGLQAVKPWVKYFHHPQGALLGILNAIFSFGAIAACPFVAWFNDRFGRKRCIIFGTFWIAIGAVLQTASINIAMFLVARFIMGFGIPFAISGASQLLAELSHPKERGVICGLFNESWYVGSILAAGITLGTYSIGSDWSWRLPSLFQLLPSTLQVIFIWFVPESPRWLISKNREEEALEILAKYHAEGDREDPFVKAEFAQIVETIHMEAEASNHSWAEMFQSRANVHRMAIAVCIGLFTQWSGNGLVSYYLAKVLTSIGITGSREQTQINLGLQCWNLVSGVSAAFLTKLLGRRTQYLMAFTGMALVFACWTGASASFAKTGNQQAAGAVVGLIFLYYGCYNLMHPLTYIYIPEIFPFIGRSKGIATTQFFSRSSAAFNTFVNPIGLANLGWKYYIVYVVWLCIESTIAFFLFPETKGPMLEELAIVFEGRKAKVSSTATMDKANLSKEEVERV